MAGSRSPEPPGDDPGPAPLPVGNDGATDRQLPGQFSQTTPVGSSGNPGSDTEKNSSTCSTFARTQESVSDPLPGTFDCEPGGLYGYTSGTMGNGDLQTQEIANNLDRAVLRDLQRCPEYCPDRYPAVARNDRSDRSDAGRTSGKLSVTRSDVVPLPGVLDATTFQPVDPAVSGRCDLYGNQPVAFRDVGSHTGLCSECYGRLVRAGNVSGDAYSSGPGRVDVVADQNGGAV